MAEAPATDALRDARQFAYENPRSDVQSMVPASARRILDLGCSSGALGAGLKAAVPGREIVGLELDPVYAERARTRLDRVEVADLEALLATPASARELVGDGYDCVIAADVLEHLREPWTALASAVALLRPGGAVVVSLPNVRYWETFWTLARHGTWPRREAGIFDATHLRWFTLGDAMNLLADAGAPIGPVDRDVLRVMKVHPWKPHRIDRRLPRIAPRGVRAFLTYQHVLVGTTPT
ncbi:class I SAM-dependent methyltransferase [Patulibacter minatonensis]|uniref:class I SAM-dependent methyltransferase n=1 Tax=Patulibacter minatonensis TaxID=298163 RepID=UPI00047D484B|nr:class I SAM-dependent methyltransferase [Patulibacter minatonensis]